MARNFQLRIGTPKTRITFDGFSKDDLERLQNLCKQVSWSRRLCPFLLRVERSLRAWMAVLQHYD